VTEQSAVAVLLVQIKQNQKGLEGRRASSGDGERIPRDEGGKNDGGKND
jgi:hypothetical protein